YGAQARPGFGCVVAAARGARLARTAQCATRSLLGSRRGSTAVAARPGAHLGGRHGSGVDLPLRLAHRRPFGPVSGHRWRGTLRPMTCGTVGATAPHHQRERRPQGSTLQPNSPSHGHRPFLRLHGHEREPTASSGTYTPGALFSRLACSPTPLIVAPDGGTPHLRRCRGGRALLVTVHLLRF